MNDIKTWLRKAVAKLFGSGELGAETVEIVVGVALVCGAGSALYGLSGAMADATSGAGAGIEAAYTGEAGDAGSASATMGDVPDASSGSSGTGGSSSGSGGSSSGSGSLKPGGSSGSGAGEGGSESTQCDDNSHSWGAWNVTKEVTCTDDGEKVRTCSKCGKSETATVYSTGHDYVDTQEASPAPKAATCTTSGMEALVKHKCSNCGATYYSGGSSIAALGHDLSDATFTWDGTTSATATFKCSHDGCDETGTVKATVTSQVTTIATCTEKGVTTYTAKATSGTGFTATDSKTATDVAINPNNHDYKIEKSTDSDGVEFTHYVCSRDSSHQYWENGSTGQTGDTKEDVGWVDHEYAVKYSWSGSGTEAAGWTCTADRYCTVHSKTEATCTGTIKSTVTTAAICTATGVATISVENFPETWANASAAGTKTATIAVLGHDYSVLSSSAVAATCTTAGKTAVYKCSRCSSTTGGTTIAATGHSYYQYSTTAAIAATCTATGTTAKTTYKCSKCGNTYSSGGTTIAALGHSYGSTYTSNGSSGHSVSCTRCGSSITSSHSYTTSGSYKICSLCGYSVYVGGGGNSYVAPTANYIRYYVDGKLVGTAKVTWSNTSLMNTYGSGTGWSAKYCVQEDPVYKCPTCGDVVTDSSDDFFYHYHASGTTENLGTTGYYCSTCDRTFSSYKSYYYNGSHTAFSHYDATCGSYTSSSSHSKTTTTTTKHSSSATTIKKTCNACGKANVTHYYCSSCGASKSKCYTKSAAGTCSTHPKKTMSSRYIKYTCAKCSTSKTNTSFSHYYCTSCATCLTSKCTKTNSTSTTKACSVYSCSTHSLSTISEVAHTKVSFITVSWISGSESAVKAYNTTVGFSGWYTNPTCTTAASTSNYGYSAVSSGLVFYGKTGGSYYECANCGHQSNNSFNHYACPRCGKCYGTSAEATHYHFDASTGCDDILSTGSSPSPMRYYCTKHKAIVIENNNSGGYYLDGYHTKWKYYCKKHMEYTDDIEWCIYGEGTMNCEIWEAEYCGNDWLYPEQYSPVTYTAQKVTVS